MDDPSTATSSGWRDSIWFPIAYYVITVALGFVTTMTHSIWALWATLAWFFIIGPVIGIALRPTRKAADAHG